MSSASLQPAPSYRGRWIIAVLAASGMAATFVAYGWLQPVPETGVSEPMTITANQRRDLDTRIELFCSSCHVFPPAASFPQESWIEEVNQGFEFARAAYHDLDEAPPVDAVVRYFVRRAPAELHYFAPEVTPHTSPIAFERQDYTIPDHSPGPGVSHVRFAKLSPPHDRVIIACDMRWGLVLLLDLRRPEEGLQIVGHLANPSHAEPVDLDRDGFIDLLVADLGSASPDNHTKGQVLWLRRDPRSAAYQSFILAEGVGRVADAQAEDFDGDGDLDIIVAAFGWRTVGELRYLENRTIDWTHPEFHGTTLEKRTGAIHVPIADLNRDGRPDFVVLFSQEHEQLVAFLNEGAGQFRREILFAAPDPAYGSTGIELVDLDQDGDIDVLYTNGDSLDSHLIKPYHGVQWLENQGTFPLRYHHLTAMPGVHRARAGDLDRDGDVDVIASAFLPNLQFPQRDSFPLDAIIWLENRNGQFVRHSVETSHCDHTTLDLADCDGDGYLDAIVGNLTWDGTTGKFFLPPIQNWITIWRNRPE